LLFHESKVLTELGGIGSVEKLLVSMEIMGPNS